MPEQRARTVEILTQREQSFNLQIFANVGHGFAVSAFSFRTIESYTDQYHSRERA